MDGKANLQKRLLVGIGGILIAASCLGCGKPMLYHFKHYRQPFAAIAESNKTYFHSGQTGKIIEKDPCGQYCEPGCFGFEPTSWTHWPEECPGSLPVQGEIVEPQVSHHPVDAEPRLAENIVEEGEAEVTDDTQVIVSPPNVSVPVLDEPNTATPDFPAPADLESAIPSPSDGTRVDPPKLPETLSQLPTLKAPRQSAPDVPHEAVQVSIRKPNVAQLPEAPTANETAERKPAKSSQAPFVSEPAQEVPRTTVAPDRNPQIDTAAQNSPSAKVRLIRISNTYQIPIGLQTTATNASATAVTSKDSTRRKQPNVVPLEAVREVREATKPRPTKAEAPEAEAPEAEAAEAPEVVAMQSFPRRTNGVQRLPISTKQVKTSTAVKLPYAVALLNTVTPRPEKNDFQKSPQSVSNTLLQMPNRTSKTTLRFVSEDQKDQKDQDSTANQDLSAATSKAGLRFSN